MVSYLNTRPLLFGMQSDAFLQAHDLIPAYPSKVAELLQDGTVDVALLPVAVLADLPEYHIVSRYCIGTDGDVASVCLFSEVPVEELTEIYLDYQSRTSVALCRILLRDFWRVSPRLLPAADEGYRTRIQGTTGAVVIGDRALEQRRLSKYVYDLSGAWKAHTGLPFVFALWVSLRPLSSAWTERFDAAQAIGLQQLPAIAAAQTYSAYDLLTYYTRNLSYELDAAKQEGMTRFLQLLRNG